MLKNRIALEIVANGLGDMLNQFVFVGGTVLELYASSDTYAKIIEVLSSLLYMLYLADFQLSLLP